MRAHCLLVLASIAALTAFTMLALAADTPSAPRDVTVTVDGCNATVSWSRPYYDGNDLIHGYRVYSCGTFVDHRDYRFDKVLRSPGWDPLDVGASTSAEFGCLTIGMTYFYVVIASNDYGEGVNSSTAWAWVTTAPSEPTDLRGSVHDDEVLLAWSRPRDDGGAYFIEYDVYRSHTGIDWEIAGRVVPPSRYGSWPTDEPERSYKEAYPGCGRHSYRVVAVTPTHAGPPSGAIWVPWTAVPSPPGALNATGMGDAVLLDWLAPESDGGSPLLGFHLSRLVPRVGWMSWGELPANATSFEDDAIVLTSYRYRVAAYNALGEGPPTEIEARTDLEGPLLGPPGNLTSERNGTVLKLGWDPPGPMGCGALSGYDVYWWSSRIYWFNPIIGSCPLDDKAIAWNHIGLGSDARDLTFRDLVVGWQYWFIVGARSGIGEGPEAEPMYVKVVDPPSEVLSLVGELQHLTIKLGWQGPEKDNGGPVFAYRVYRGNSSSDMELFLTIGSTIYDWGLYREPATNCTIYLQNARTYLYRVTAVNPAGEGPATELAFPPPDPPGEPTNARAMVTGDWVTLRWSPPYSTGGAPINGYLVSRRQGSSDWTLVAALPAGELLFIDREVSPGMNYSYRIEATTVGGIGAPTDVMEAQVPPEAPPVPPPVLEPLPDPRRPAFTAAALVTTISTTALLATGVAILLVLRRRRTERA